MYDTDCSESEDSLTSDPVSESEPIDEAMKRLKAENMALRQQVEDLREDLVQSRSTLNHCHLTLQQISSLRKPFYQPPPEILHMIFERTIPPHFVVDPSACHSPNSMWCQVLQQRQSIINVCHMWHDIGLPFLYEDICIRHISQLKQLLSTLESSAANVKQFVKVVSIHCLVPVWFGEMLEERLKRLFAICPRINKFSYLSSCRLPRPTSLSALPPNVTSLQLVDGVSKEMLRNILPQIAPTIISLSIHVPYNDFTSTSNPEVNFLCLEELSCGITSGTLAYLNTFINWKMPILRRLTFRMHGSWQGFVPTDRLVIFCRLHCAGLRFLHVYPEYGWSMRHYTIRMQDLLDTCPALEHIVVHPKTDIPLMHKRVKWVDIWSSHSELSCYFYWKALRATLTSPSFPMLQSVRRLSSSVSFNPDLPLILPPRSVLTPLDAFGYCFLDLDVRHDVEEIYRAYPTGRLSPSYFNDGEDSSDESESDEFQPVPTDSEYDSEGSDSLDWEVDSERYHTREWDAGMDALE